MRQFRKVSIAVLSLSAVAFVIVPLARPYLFPVFVLVALYYVIDWYNMRGLKNPFLGHEARAVDMLNPNGKILLAGEEVDAEVQAGTCIQSGEVCRVVGFQNGRYLVEGSSPEGEG